MRRLLHRKLNLAGVCSINSCSINTNSTTSSSSCSTTTATTAVTTDHHRAVCVESSLTGLRLTGGPLRRTATRLCPTSSSSTTTPTSSSNSSNHKSSGTSSNPTTTSSPFAHHAGRPETLAVAWKSALPPASDARWEGVGRAVINLAAGCDTGPEAFAEVLEARRQLEIIVQASGYDLSIHAFGSLAVMGMLEVGGDVDFTAVAEVEPQPEEASEIVARLSREMRRLGLRCNALSKARVPVIKVERASTALPGSPMHSASACGAFQFGRPLTTEEQALFAEVVTVEYHATHCEWDPQAQCATVKFPDSHMLMIALTHVRCVGAVEIPVRLPADVRQGPEVYRFPFDLCLSSTGLYNSYILGRCLLLHPFARHMVLALKRWGRSSGVVNSVEGLLASYAITVLLVHFLARIDMLPVVDTSIIAGELQLPKDLAYTPLATADDVPVDVVKQTGYAFALFFEYYGNVFDYENEVVCTTRTKLLKSEVGWDAATIARRLGGMAPERPPFYHLAIKDPYGHENIGRNLGPEAALFVREAAVQAAAYIAKDIDDPNFMVDSVVMHAPRPVQDPVNGTFNPRFQDPASQTTLDAFRKLKKLEFHRRRDSLQRFGQSTMRQHSNVKVAQDVTRSVLSWIQSDQPQQGK